METELVTYRPEFAIDFKNLNLQWIEKYFTVEVKDIEQLSQPVTKILEPGGEIFFVRRGQKTLGTCAMIPVSAGVYEIAKMAVAPEAQGLGLGDRLMRACVEWANAKKATKIIILSNTVLEPAIALYKKHGFKTTHLGKHPDYDRCNIEMELILEQDQYTENKKQTAGANPNPA